ncbi:MAG: hypothetical protein V4719_29500 [Planctomycetota bacterium]
MDDQAKTYSIQLRLRRVIYEDAYVAVPVTRAIMMPRDDGTFVINPEAFKAEALGIGNLPNVEWQFESSQTEPHPLQGPKPEGRTSLDAF